MKRRVPAIVLGLVAFGCLGAMAMQVGESAPGAPPSTGSGTTDTKTFRLWDPIVGSDFQWYEKVLLVLNVFVALGGLAYALMLVGQVRKAHARHEEDAGDRPGRPRGGQRLSLPAIPRGGRADRADHGPALLRRRGVRACRRRSAWGRAIAFLVGSIVLGHGRLCRHAAGHDRQPPRGRRRPEPASARPCSWATAPARSPAC